MKEPSEPYEVLNEEWFSGGRQTVFVTGNGAFGAAFPYLRASLAAVHEVGDVAFGQTFVSAPAAINPGLGPVFNNVSCLSCHIGDGRGKAPEAGEPLSSLLLRISLDGTNVHGGPLPVPGFGGQLQQRAVFGVSAEALVDVSYTYTTHHFADGESFELRSPQFNLLNSYVPLPAGVQISPRIAPPVFGLGLLAAIDENDLQTLADPHDSDGDGISGRLNRVWNEVTQQHEAGRFGWKAGQPTLLQQVAGAYHEDMGITSGVFPLEACAGQVQHDSHSDDPELNDSLLQATTLYVQTLAVPGRRKANDPAVQRGKKIFMEAGCASCHVAKHRTRTDVTFPEISNQLIFPYTDLLLHDMGEGLSDYRSEFEAGGTEWRTPPLWGIGLTAVVNGHTNFLHDGRARNLMEAVMWHGGEAADAREYVRNLSAEERKALLAFLESL